MDQSLKQLYTIMLLNCSWVKKHEILLDSNGWIEEHTIQTVDGRYYTFEIKFVIDMINSYIEIIGITINKSETNYYPFIESGLI